MIIMVIVVMVIVVIVMSMNIVMVFMMDWYVSVSFLSYMWMIIRIVVS